MGREVSPAGCLLAACWQASPIDRELPTRMSVASLFLWEKLFFLTQRKFFPIGGERTRKQSILRTAALCLWEKLFFRHNICPNCILIAFR